MNSTLTPKAGPSAFETPEEEDFDIGRYLEVLQSNKWLIAGIALVVFVAGFIYAFLEKPVYESAMVIQVENSEGGGGGKGALAEAGGLVDVRAPASAEIEILRSRMIATQAAEAANLFVVASPRYIPYIGGWLARRSTSLSDPGFLGQGGYVSGQERIEVSKFNVPEALEGAGFLITAKEGGRYALSGPGLAEPLGGTVGTMLKATSTQGPIELLVTELAGKPGAEFDLQAQAKLPTIIGLQNSLSVFERGRASGIINVSRQDTDPYKLTRVLNAVGAEYVRQNIERKAAEAQKTLAFLDVQLPQFKKQLEASEDVYNRYRNQKGTVDFSQAASTALTQSVDRQTKLLEAQQRRRELEARFTSAHPLVQTLDAQIAALKTDLGEIQQRIKQLPEVQQEAVRMERDVKVNTELYQSLLNNALQLRLVKEGKIGTG